MSRDINIEDTFVAIKGDLEILLAQLEDNLRDTPVNGLRWSCAFAAWSDVKNMIEEELPKVKESYDTSRKDTSWEKSREH